MSCNMVCVHGQKIGECRFGCNLPSAEDFRLENEKLQAELKKHQELCKWKYVFYRYDDTDDLWETGCGQAFTLYEGKPKDNKMKYCPFCGKLIKVVR